jgi:hypothetical protein
MGGRVYNARNNPAASERGFALPSILLLITILVLVALSIVTLQYFRRQMSSVAIAKVKAEYAAQSGIAKMVSAVAAHHGPLSSLQGLNNIYSFIDGSEARVTAEPWGVFLLLTSEGRFQRVKYRRTAITAARSTGDLENALIFGNSDHQLVFAGNSFVEGDIVVGMPGITSGTLPGVATSGNAAVEGSVIRKVVPAVSPYDSTLLISEINYYKNLLAGYTNTNGNNSHTMVYSSGSAFSSGLGKIPDSVNMVVVQSDVVLTDSSVRRGGPLFLVVLGRVCIQDHAHVGGPLSIIASKDIVVSGTATIDQAILFSQDSVQVGENISFSAQIISPVITVQRGSVGHYPSVLLSYGGEDVSRQRRIVLNGNATIEGAVMLLQAGKNMNADDMVQLDASALIVGALYSQNKTMLDGRVIGTVMTKDFFFYQAPTKYNGWLRTGSINRKILPQGFLMPVGFSSNPQLDVLEWL